MKKILLFSLLTVSFYTNAQLSNLCNYSENNISESKLLYDRVPNDAYISGIIKEIENSIKISGNFIVFNYPGYNNCAALNYYGTRIIVYDPQFLQKISNQKKHITTSIIAHEIAHHLLNHTLIETYDLEIKRKQELEADYLSAVIMKKLGYSLNQSLEGVNKLADLNDDKNYTHPLKEKRNLVITEVFESTDNDANNYISRVLSFSKQGSLKIINGKNYGRAMDLIDNGNFRDALIELNKLTKIDEFLYLLGKIRKIEAYRETHNEQNALSVALSLEDDLKDPNFIINRFDKNHRKDFIGNYILFNIGGSYELLNQPFNALMYLEKASNYLPDDKILKSKIGILNFDLGNFDKSYEYLSNNDLEIFLIENNFSKQILKKLLVAKVISYEKTNRPAKEINDLYNKILNSYTNFFSEDDLSDFVTLQTNFLIKDFEQTGNIWNEFTINELFIKYKNFDKINKEKSKKYLILLLYFYDENNIIFDKNGVIQKEITNLMNKL